jgi:hypothetical protein
LHFRSLWIDLTHNGYGISGFVSDFHLSHPRERLFGLGHSVIPKCNVNCSRPGLYRGVRSYTVLLPLPIRAQSLHSFLFCKAITQKWGEGQSLFPSSTE